MNLSLCTGSKGNTFLSRSGPRPAIACGAVAAPSRHRPGGALAAPRRRRPLDLDVLIQVQHRSDLLFDGLHALIDVPMPV